MTEEKCPGEKLEELVVNCEKVNFHRLMRGEEREVYNQLLEYAGDFDTANEEELRRLIIAGLRHEVMSSQKNIQMYSDILKRITECEVDREELENECLWNFGTFDMFNSSVYDYCFEFYVNKITEVDDRFLGLCYEVELAS